MERFGIEIDRNFSVIPDPARLEDWHPVRLAVGVTATYDDQSGAEVAASLWYPMGGWRVVVLP